MAESHADPNIRSSQKGICGIKDISPGIEFPKHDTISTNPFWYLEQVNDPNGHCLECINDFFLGAVYEITANNADALFIPTTASIRQSSEALAVNEVDNVFFQGGRMAGGLVNVVQGVGEISLGAGLIGSGAVESATGVGAVAGVPSIAAGGAIAGHEGQISQEQIIQNKWKENKCPIINGIIFGDGRIIQVNFQESEHNDAQKSPTIVAQTTIREFIARFDDYFTDLTSLCESQLSERDLLITGGGGGFGGDGYVALSRLSDDYLVWIAFFDESNPFVKVSSDNRAFVTGITTLGDLWQFPIDHPEHLTWQASK